jgi:hypothetical protein
MSAHKGDTEKFRTPRVDDLPADKRRVMGSDPRFDPYKGAADKAPGRKKDLRKVEEWLKAKRLAEAAKRDNQG